MSQADQGVTPERRREQILSYLSARDRSSVGELSQTLGVSEVTVRKDLDLLESQGQLTRVHGGAMISGRGRLELYFAAREQEHLEEKRRIAQAAAALIRSGQRIFLDASTTALQVTRLIKDREDLTVVTNGLYTALELNFCEGITTIVVGGIMRRRSSSLVGSLSYHVLQRLRVDIGLFGARAVTAGQAAHGQRVRRGRRHLRLEQVRRDGAERFCAAAGDRPDHHRRAGASGDRAGAAGAGDRGGSGVSAGRNELQKEAVGKPHRNPAPILRP
jgi:DeoR/GlpR family transcriptional regulator of sugar metabolism